MQKGIEKRDGCFVIRNSLWPTINPRVAADGLNIVPLRCFANGERFSAR
jgi:hypothetical protein